MSNQSESKMQQNQPQAILRNISNLHPITTIGTALAIVVRNRQLITFRWPQWQNQSTATKTTTTTAVTMSTTHIHLAHTLPPLSPSLTRTVRTMGAVDDMDSGHLADTPSKQEFYIYFSTNSQHKQTNKNTKRVCIFCCLHLAFFRKLFLWLKARTKNKKKGQK